MIRVALYTQEASGYTNFKVKTSYRAVDEDNTAFIYGEGMVRFRKNKIIEIPKFNFTGCIHTVSELIDFVSANKEFTFKYLDDYGYEVITDQLQISSNAASTAQSYYFISHLQNNRDILDYLIEVRSIHVEVMNFLLRNLDKFSSHYKYNINTLSDFQRFCRFDWMMGTWGINLLSTSMTGVKNDLFTEILEEYADIQNLGEISFNDTLEHMKKGLGVRVEKGLTYHSFITD